MKYIYILIIALSLTSCKGLLEQALVGGGSKTEEKTEQLEEMPPEEEAEEVLPGQQGQQVPPVQ